MMNHLTDLKELAKTMHERTLGELQNTRVGDFIRFKEEKLKYEVIARSDRFLICTKPFNARRTVLYCIVDLVEWIRGPENLIFDMGCETKEQAEEMLERVRSGESEISYRNRITLSIEKVIIK